MLNNWNIKITLKTETTTTISNFLGKNSCFSNVFFFIFSDANQNQQMINAQTNQNQVKGLPLVSLSIIYLLREISYTQTTKTYLWYIIYPIKMWEILCSCIQFICSSIYKFRFISMWSPEQLILVLRYLTFWLSYRNGIVLLRFAPSVFWNSFILDL